jgi:hypothetical protein
MQSIFDSSGALSIPTSYMTRPEQEFVSRAELGQQGVTGCVAITCTKHSPAAPACECIHIISPLCLIQSPVIPRDVMFSEAEAVSSAHFGCVLWLLQYCDLVDLLR